METRRRGHSFYEDEDNEEDIQVRVKSGSPSPERSRGSPAEDSRDINNDADFSESIPVPEIIYEDQDGSTGGTDAYAFTDASFENVSHSTDTEEIEEDPQPRGRGRSRSMCTHLIDPSNLPTPSTPTEGGHLGDSRSSSTGSSTSDGESEDGDHDKRARSKSADRVGPLTQHEVQVLQKGLLDATKALNRDELQEEEEERRAAKAEEEERLVMAGKHGPGKLGNSGDSNPNTSNASSSSSVRNFFSRDKNNNARSISSDSGTGSNNETAEALRQASQDGTSSSSAPFKPSSPSVMQKYTLGSENNNMRRFKILLLGDSGVGKSSLILRWTEDRYLATLTGTVGVNFKSKKVTIDEEAVHIQVWDTAGQQQFHKITTSYYRGAHGIMIVYDVSDPESLANVEYWIRNIKTHAAASVRVLLVGNKTDLRAKYLAAHAHTHTHAQADVGSKKYASTGSGSTEGEEGEGEGDEDDDTHAALASPTVCTDYGAGREIADKFQIPYFETSALDASGTDNAFMNIARFCVGIEDGNKSLLVPTGDTGHLPSGTTPKPSMISRMMGRGTAAPPKAAPTPPQRAKTAFAPPHTGGPAAAVAGGKGAHEKEKKKCTMQ